MPPSIRFCRTADGASIAYAVDGDGPPLLLPAWWVSHVERTARLRDAIARIRAAHPELGRHLEESIATGTFCSYDPREPVSWRTSTG